METERVARLVSSFGGGMGRLREVCGGVSGALFVLGALRGYSDPEASDEKAAHYARVQEFARRFRAEHETIVCRELLKNLNINKPTDPKPEPRTGGLLSRAAPARALWRAPRASRARCSRSEGAQKIRPDKNFRMGLTAPIRACYNALNH